MIKVLSKAERKELRKAMEKVCEIAGTCFICCNIRESEKDENGSTLNLINGRSNDLGQSIATALKDEKELRECVDIYLNAGDSLEKIKKALKGFLDELDK